MEIRVNVSVPEHLEARAMEIVAWELALADDAQTALPYSDWCEAQGWMERALELRKEMRCMHGGHVTPPPRKCIVCRVLLQELPILGTTTEPPTRCSHAGYSEKYRQCMDCGAPLREILDDGYVMVEGTSSGTKTVIRAPWPMR